MKATEVAGAERVPLNATSPLVQNVTRTTIQNHMLMETPKMTFFHFEMTGDLNQTITILNQTLNLCAEERVYTTNLG